MVTGVRLNVPVDTLSEGCRGKGKSAQAGSKDPRCRPIQRKLREMLDSHRWQRRDVEDVINSVLGRDPGQIWPFALSWGPLIDSLDRNVITITEDELIATPFVFEFSDSLLAELEANDRD
jgi:hypothetical protein